MPCSIISSYRFHRIRRNSKLCVLLAHRMQHKFSRCMQQRLNRFLFIYCTAVSKRKYKHAYWMQATLCLRLFVRCIWGTRIDISSIYFWIFIFFFLNIVFTRCWHFSYRFFFVPFHKLLSLDICAYIYSVTLQVRWSRKHFVLEKLFFSLFVCR